MFNLNNTQSVTHQRNVYTTSMFNLLLAQAAKDLESGLTTREVAIPAVSKIIAASVPNTGEGHAAMVKTQVESEIDNILASAEESTESEEA